VPLTGAWRVESSQRHQECGTRGTVNGEPTRPVSFADMLPALAREPLTWCSLVALRSVYAEFPG